MERLSMRKTGVECQMKQQLLECAVLENDCVLMGTVQWKQRNC